MKCADLHIHSNYSDGCYTPEKIVECAIKNNIKCISITDHDSINSQYITQNKNNDINIIPGIEISTEYKDIEIHMLGYFIDINNKELNECVEFLNIERIKRVENILYKLKTHGVNLSIDDIQKESHVTVGRSQIANAMVEKGYFPDYKSAFQRYLIKGKEAYEKGYKLHYKEAIDIIKSANGIAVLAHPGQIYKKREVENIIRDLRCFGMDGIEVYHPSHSREEINNFFNISKKYKMAVTGGSDFHGIYYNKNNGIGSTGLNEKMLEQLLRFNKRKSGG